MGKSHLIEIGLKGLQYYITELPIRANNIQY